MPSGKSGFSGLESSFSKSDLARAKSNSLPRPSRIGEPRQLRRLRGESGLGLLSGFHRRGLVGHGLGLHVNGPFLRVERRARFGRGLHDRRGAVAAGFAPSLKSASVEAMAADLTGSLAAASVEAIAAAFVVSGAGLALASVTGVGGAVGAASSERG